MESSIGASFSLHFKSNEIIVYLLYVPKDQENLLVACLAKHFENSQVVEVHSQHVVLSCKSTRLAVDPFSHKSPLPRRLEILAVLCDLLEDLSKLGWKLTTQSIHGNLPIVKRKSTIYFDYCLGPAKEFSCLVENGLSRRLLLRKSQSSDQLLANLNVALIEAYPKFKKGPHAPIQLYMVKVEEEERHANHMEYVDDFKTKLQYPCQFVTTAVDFFQLTGFECPVALSLFGDAMVVVLLAMPNSQSPDLEARLASDESHVFNLIIQPTKMRSIVCENAPPEIRKTLKKCFYENRRWKMSAEMWSPQSIQGRLVLFHLTRHFGLMGWKPLFTLDGLGYPYTVIIFTQFMAEPVDSTLLSGIFHPQNMVGLSSLQSNFLKIRSEYQTPPTNALRIVRNLDCVKHWKDCDFKGDFNFSGDQATNGFVSMLKVFSAFTKEGWTVLASWGKSSRGLGSGTNQIWFLCKMDGLLGDNASVPAEAQPPLYHEIACALPLEPPPPYSIEDPLLQASAPPIEFGDT
ncbi:uncharacterized protein LOC131891137 [Tigriopus californicus]|uniref:uncharacterized protein LOC131891137 n=1 Tax=Tigriopus californicus TaxID=6832 RepID=UPI0027DA3B80|nr:uncharacterized protein LOC131891137 [Tigriopus californicus]